MKKILYIVPEYPFGGAERQIMELAKLGFNNNFEVAILDIKAQEDRNIDGVRIYGLNSDILQKDRNKWSRNIYRIKVYFEIYNFVKNRNYDFICIFFHLFLPLIFFRKLNIVFSVREFERKYFKGFYKYMIKKARIVTTNNMPSYIYLKDIHKNAYIINNIINNKQTEAKMFPKNKEYLIVSNIATHKNILPVVRAFAELKNFKLKIAGKIVDEQYYKELKQYFSENIEYIGFLSKDELEKQYLNTEGIIHLSMKEGTPNAILDAIRFEKPFLALETPENMCLLETYSDFILRDYEVSNITKAILKLNKRIENDDFEIRNNLSYFKSKLKNIYTIDNGKNFYEILKEVRK